MLSTTTDKLTDFLNFWNNNHLETQDHGVPLNMYNISALSAGIGFTLKWFISKEDFDKIAEDINYIFGEDKTRMLIVAGQDRIELEIDTHHIVTGFKEEVSDIDTVFEELAKHETL